MTSDGGDPREAGSDPGRRRRNSWDGLARSIVVLVLVSAAGACARPAPSLSPAARADVRAQVVEIEERIWGSKTERLAADQLTYVRYQGQIQKCMASAGFDYTPPPFESGYTRPSMTTRALADDEVLAPVDTVSVERDRLLIGVDYAAGLAEKARAAAARNPGFEELGPREREAYGRASNACEPALESYGNLSSPAETDHIAGELNAVLERAYSTSVVRSALGRYRSCLKDLGYPVSERAELRVRAQQAYLDPAMGAVSEPGSARWRAAERFELDAARADAECRKPAYDAALDALAGPVGEFARTHQAELAAADRYWSGLAILARQEMPEFRRLTRPPR